MDIVRLMLLSRQMKNRRHEKDNMVTGIPPLTFTANKTGLLKNYRIYGNTETLTRTYSGSAPLSFPIVDGAVSNYRVYGNTVGGESVGDRTGNLFDINSPLLYDASISRLNISDTVCIFPYGIGDSRRCIFIPVEPNTTYTFSCRTAGDKLVIATYNKRYTKAQLDLYTTDNRLISDGEIIFDIQKGYKLCTFTTPATTNMIGIYYQLNISATDIMLNKGSTALPYEPYGYRIPITNNSETANIYLDELLTKSGDNADYIDYAEQKRYNADGTSEDVTLPALPAQSTLNSFSVGTIIQPSSVAVDVDEVVSCGDKVTDSQSVNYGKYKIPVTLTADSAETTDIYLDAPLAKSGNNADYIDYAAQKRHNSDGTESNVTLPEIAVTAGTNTLTIDTEVQPSRVELTGRIKEAQINGSGNT